MRLYAPASYRREIMRMQAKYDRYDRYDGRRFGRWIRDRRRALDMTQRELAAEVGCSDSTLRKFEAGTRRPSRQMVERLARFFGASPDEQQTVMEWARLGDRPSDFGLEAEEIQNHQSKLPSRL